MFKQTKNKVAKILKIYSILNVIGGIIIARYLSWNLPGNIADRVSWIYVAAVIVVSFLIFTIGEIVNLLAQIRDNTKASKNVDDDPSIELPDL